MARSPLLVARWHAALALGAFTLAGCGGTETETVTQTLCGEVCELGESSCQDGRAVLTCVEGQDGCPVLEVEVCGQDDVCEEGACVPRQCPDDACSIGESACVDEGTLSVCVEGRDGCGVLVESACGERAVCQDGACVGDCVDGDGDGFGAGCEAGEDCDDGNAEINPDAAERCDGVDNNCDDAVDEGFDDLGDACEEGTGVCQAAGTRVCAEDGLGTTCDAVPGAPGPLDLCGTEADEDCDGEVDEGFDDLGEDCQAGVGECVADGQRVCAEDGTETVCDAQPGTPAEVELCDDADDDCDGEVDEDFRLGEECEEGIGACLAQGVRVCAEDGTAVCDAVPGDAGDVDLCGNGVDDDCDGAVDEGFDDLGTICDVGIGACRAVGVRICSEDGLGTQCSAVEGEAADDDLCGNGIDDDCDEEVDEGFEALGTTCEEGEGACGAQGALVCSEDRLSMVCGVQEGEPGIELCDGIDNDCDIDVDEDFPELGLLCQVGEGICRAEGIFICAANRQGIACSVEPGQRNDNELCGNDLDDDCDGEVDEGFVGLGDACSVGVGECLGEGTVVCSGDLLGVVCDAVEGAAALEVCDGRDNDCDGFIDGPQVCGACEEDAFEPNQVIAEATALSLGQQVQAQACFFDQDLYTLGELESGVFQVNVLFSHEEADIDVSILRNGEFYLQAQGGFSSNDNEQVVFPVTEAGEFTVNVQVNGGGGATGYRLAALRADLCRDDLFEPDNTPAQAQPLLPDTTVERTSCPSAQEGSDDFYALGDVPASTRIDVVALFSHAQGNLDVEVSQLVDGELVVRGAGNSQTNDENFEVLIEQGGPTFIRVLNLSPGARNTYLLRYSRVDDICEPDGFEPNDTPSELRTNGQGLTALNLTACSTDDDWWLVTPAGGGQEWLAGDIIAINATFSSTQGDLDLELYRLDVNDLDNPTAVAFSNSLDDNETLRYTVEQNGLYAARIFSVEGQPNYRLSVLADRQDGCIDDGYERDNFLTFAIQGEPGKDYALTLCPAQIVNNETEFEFDIINVGELEAGVAIEARADFTHARGDIDLRLFVDGSFVDAIETGGVSEDDNEDLSFTTAVPGEYFLVLFLDADGNGESDGNAYRLRYTLGQGD